MNAVAFEITNIRRQDGKSLRAFFDITIPGAIIADCRLHVGKHGTFVAGPGMKSNFAIGGWKTHAELDADLALEIQEAVEARLAADEGGDHVA